MKKLFLVSALLVASFSAMAAPIQNFTPNFNIQTNDDLKVQPNSYVAYGSQYAAWPFGSCDATPGGRYECSGIAQSVNQQKLATVTFVLSSQTTGDQCTIAFNTVVGSHRAVYDQVESSCSGPNNWLLTNIPTPTGPSVRVSQNY